MQSNVVPMTQVEDFPIQPLQDIVIVEQLVDEKTRGGIILAGGSGEFASGRVVAVGPGRTYSSAMDASGHTDYAVTVPMTVKVGDYVIFGKYQSGGEPILIDGKKYLMCREGDLGGRSRDGSPLKIKLAID